MNSKSPASEDLAPRVYGPGKPREVKVEHKLFHNFIRVEIIVGGGLIAAGGFALRATGTYEVLVIGGCLLAVGFFHLSRLDLESDLDQSAFPDDRLLFRVRTALSPDYFIALDYPLPDGGKIDTLVVGPQGAFVLKKLTLRGRLEPGADEQSWRHKPPSEEDFREIDNPFRENQKLCSELRSFLSSSGIAPEEFTMHNCLVLMYHRVEGPLLEEDFLFRLGEVPGFIRDYQPSESERLNWEKVNELEAALKENMHRLN